MFPDTGILDLHIDERINQSETLWLTLRASDPKARELTADVELVLDNGRRYFIVETVKGRLGSQATVIVQAEAAWTKLADSMHIGTLAFAANDLADVLTIIVDVKDFQGWTYDLDGVDDDIPISFEATDATMLDLIRKVAKLARCGVEFDTVNNVVRFVPQLGTTRGLAFTYGRNLTDVERRESPPLVTRLYPFGRDDIGIKLVEPDGLGYIENWDYYTAQGLTEDQARDRYLKERIWKDDKYTNREALYDAALDMIVELADATVSYTMGVADLTGLTQVTEDDYVIGDTVLTSDAELHFTNVRTRIVRIDRYPLEPWRNVIELSYLRVVAPDPDVSGGRTDSTLEWELFASRNAGTARYVGAVRTVLNRLILNTTTGAEWVIGYNLEAEATGSGTVTIEAIDTGTDETITPPVTLDVTSGERVQWSFQFGELEVPAGQYNLVVRATGNSGGELNIEPGGTSFYALARGTTQTDLTLTNSIRYDVVGGGAVQEFEVPDDVSEIRIEAHGAAGGNSIGDHTGGAGGMMAASFTVLPGQIYDVYVGEWTDNNTGSSPTGGWPDGGSGSGAATGGGGRSEVRPDGAAITAALIIAGGGGGEGSGDIDAQGDVSGGAGAYPIGEDAGGGFPDVTSVNTGGTQTAGGDGAGSTAFGNGAQGAGGAVVPTGTEDWVGSPSTLGGGGGGGWYGGGGGGNGNGARGGGGGSGYVGDGAYDLEVANGENVGAPGYVIISWENPA